MLVLTRKEGERVVIADEVRVTVLAVHGNRVTLGFEAPSDVSILREELQRRIETCTESAGDRARELSAVA